MNTVIPQATKPPIPAPAGARTTTPAPGTVDQPALPEAECDTFRPSPLRNFLFPVRNMFSIYGPVNLPAPAECLNK